MTTTVNSYNGVQQQAVGKGVCKRSHLNAGGSGGGEIEWLAVMNGTPGYS